MSDPAVIELVSRVDSFLSLSDKFVDEDLDMALSRIVKLILKPDIPAQTAVTTIVQLQAIAAKLYIEASYFKNIERPKSGTLDYEKKNMYFSIAEALNELIAALKYSVRGYNG